MSIYVITGGAGFIGAALATHLGRAGYQVRALDNFSTPGSRQRADALCALPTVAVIEGDVRDEDACRRVCADADFVLHHAASQGSADNPATCAEVIIGGTVNMLISARAAGSVRRFVCASSGDVYGDTPALTKHEASPADPITSEASALLSAEHFCRSAYRLHGFQTVCLRYFSVYGPGLELSEDRSTITCLLSAAVGGETAMIHGDGEQSGDFLYVDDAVEANLRAVSAQRGVGGKVFNIGSGQRFSVTQLREKLERLTGHELAVEYASPRAGDIKHLRADVSAAAGLLQFCPVVGLDEGLSRTLQWAKDNIHMEQGQLAA